MERNARIVQNMPLVYSRAHYLKVEYNPDAIQEGMLGLIKAVDRYDAERGVAFSTFAVPYIDSYIRTFNNLNRVIKPKRVGTSSKFCYCETVPIDNAEWLSNSQNDLATFVEAQISIEQLGEIEKKVASLRSQGMSWGKIRSRLHIGTPTLDRIRKTIKRKLQ